MENHQVDPLIALLDELCTDPTHNGTQLHSLDGPTESRTSPNPQGHSKSLTPLGEPISQASAMSLAEDPLSWHLRYWLGLLSVATLHSQDVMLTAARIDHEIEQIQNLDLEIKIEIKKAWHYQLMKIADEVKRQEHLKHVRSPDFWDPPTLDSRSKSLLRDLDRMLEDKEEKTRKYIRQQEGTMNAWLRAGAYDTARCIFDRVVQLYQRLEEEEATYSGARRSDIHEETEIYEMDSGCEIYEMDSG